MTYLELCARLDFDLTKVTASGGDSNAAGLGLYYYAVSRPSRSGVEITPNLMRATSCTQIASGIS